MGYITAGIGKWHLGADHVGLKGAIAKGTKDVNFTKPAIRSQRMQLDADYYFGIDANLDTKDQTPTPNALTVLIENETYIDPPANGKNLSPSFYDKPLSQWFLNAARTWMDKKIEAKKTDGKPFFLYFAPLAAHTPIYPADTLDGIKVKGATGFPNGKNGVNRMDCIYEVSVLVSLLTKYLKDKGEFDNTLFVFSSDNGANSHKHPMTTSGDLNPPESGYFTQHKASIAEGGHRIPAFVTWPDGDVPAGQVSGALWGLNDLYASFSHLLGYKLKDTEAEDSENVLDIILGKTTESTRRPLINHNDNAELIKNGSHAGAIAIRTKDWKLIVDGKLAHGNGFNAIGLFDMKNAPKKEYVKGSENLLNNAAHKAIQDSLTTIIKAYAADGHSRVFGE